MPNKKDVPKVTVATAARILNFILCLGERRDLEFKPANSHAKSSQGSTEKIDESAKYSIMEGRSQQSRGICFNSVTSVEKGFRLRRASIKKGFLLV